MIRSSLGKNKLKVEEEKVPDKWGSQDKGGNGLEGEGGCQFSKGLMCQSLDHRQPLKDIKTRSVTSASALSVSLGTRGGWIRCLMRKQQRWSW
jgi:hypothetical protein